MTKPTDTEKTLRKLRRELRNCRKWLINIWNNQALLGVISTVELDLIIARIDRALKPGRKK